VRPYYRNIDCCVLMFDVTDQRSFEALKEWKQEFLRERKPEEFGDFPFIVLGSVLSGKGKFICKGTKVDKGGRQVDTKKAREWCKSGGNMLYYDIKLNDNHLVKQAFEVIGRWAAGKDLDLIPDNTDVESVSSSPAENRNSSRSKPRPSSNNDCNLM